ncbi:autotransporter domain-containing protein [Bartonella sp. HY406]|uniref:autotransporter domain-containing protein n=1 Tax=Bartonella sp. HY406 TaxID=2979331 RepID=UPI0021C67430|nr:autotransporter domain-containing protein [Bartonella sp. HY406]UXN03899.1 autotransporter domain-containing protein [Bartonella sp. HY406]
MVCFDKRFSLKYSASRFALALILGTAIVASLGSANAIADTISYDDTSSSATLKNAPTYVSFGSNSLYVGTFDTPAASNNTVTLDYTGANKTSPNNVFGGLVKNGISENNVVLIKNGSVSFTGIGGNVYGGYGFGNQSVTVRGNSVNISGGNIGGSVFGGVGAADVATYADVGALIVNDNSVTLGGTGKVAGNLNGGAVNGLSNASSITVNGNSVTVTSGSAGNINGALIQGNKSLDTTANNNSVTITGGQTGSVSGVFAHGKGIINVNSNVVNITGATVRGNIYGADGASTDSVTVSNNSVSIHHSGMVETISGGKGEANNSATVSNNSVEISGNGSAVFVYGGEGGSDGTATVAISGNSVLINESSAGTIVGGYNSGYSFNNLNNDTAVISNNSVIMNGGTAGQVLGGEASFTNTATISDNLVKISDAEVLLTSGGYARTSGTGATNISGNSVEISGTSKLGSVYGGYAIGSGSGDVNVTNNSVTLIGDKITIATYSEEDDSLEAYGSIWGGRATISGADVTDFDKVVQGNTLNLVGYRGTVSGIYNFQNYNWTLPSNVVNGDTLVTIADGGTAVDLTNTRHSIADMQVSDNRLQNGDSITFISKTTGDWSASSPYTIKQGQFIIYEATLAQQASGADNALVLTIGGKTDTTPAGSNPVDGIGQSAAQVNPQSESYSEGRAASLGFANQGADLISSELGGIASESSAQGNGASAMPFMVMNGSSQRNNTGSHVDIKGFNMALGIATGFDFSAGHKVTLGAFFEYGRGTYDTYNSFTNFASVQGDGDSEYKGGGVFGRLNLAGTGLGRVSTIAPDQTDGVYLEASLRAGRISSNFDAGRNMRSFSNDGDDYRGSYDSKSSYYGGHIAGGYVFNFDEKQSLDTFGRYLWTHMDGDTVSVGNEKLSFDSSTSSRMQIGGRYGYAYNEQFKPYLGAAYEYEFGGEVAAKAYEFDIEKPSLGGSTGIFEAGFNIKPISTNKALSLDVNGQGYAGQRQGGGGGVKLKYQF